VWNKWEYGSNPLTTILDANSNLDTTLTSGFYRLNDATIPTKSNIPDLTIYRWGQMIVSRGQDTFVQIIFPQQNNYIPLIRCGIIGSIGTIKFDYFKSSDSDKLGGIPASYFPQYNTNNDLLIKAKNTTDRGGLISLAKAPNSNLAENIYIDTTSNMLRIFTTMDAGGVNYKYAQLNFTDLPVGANYLATFKGSTTDITAGVTNIGRAQLFIVYE
jgi:outer membrane lipoprotein-sorting protein